MSGIFKGDSIYKSGGGGGGGGGYKDGGQLIDGEYIKVENNTVSTYDNTSRDEINFYLEPKDGEIVNSVIELTTAVNAIVCVYVYNSVTRIYTPLYYNINTVNAGDTYNITINGNNFYISDPIAPPPSDFLDEVDGILYKCVKIGTKTFMAENYRGNISGATKYTSNGVSYYYPNNVTNVKNWTFPNNWRLPTQDDMSYFQSVLGSGYAPKLKSNNTAYSTWNSGANNSTGASIKPDGYYNTLNSAVLNLGTYYYFIGLTSTFPIEPRQFFLKDDSNTVGGGAVSTNRAFTIRLIKD